MTRERSSLGSVSAPMRRALAILHADGEACHGEGGWQTSRDRTIPLATMTALFARHLVKIVTESRHRRRHTARLTELGEYAAFGARRIEDIDAGGGIAPALTEQAQHLIAEITA